MALVHAELTATCNSLGCAGADKYCIDPQCSEAIRDLIKFLRRDGDDHEIRRYLGEANIVETDLLPILVQYSHKTEMFDLLIRLLVNLTTPALLIYNEQPPVDKNTSQYYLQMVTHLQKYKRAFTDVNVWKVLVDKLAFIIQAEYHEIGEEKVLSIVRLLILVRNVLHVPADNDAECRPDNDANLHDQILWAMHQSQLIDIIMYIACSDNEQQYYLHALEIISLMLRDQNAAELANAAVNRTETEKQRDVHELQNVLEKERKEKLDRLKKFSGSRHTRFGGRFVISGMKSIGDNDMVVSSMTSNVNKAFDRYKKPLKTPRNRMPLKETGIDRKSAFSVRLFLKEFCVEFLHGSYNTLMKYVREMLVRSKGQPNDESYYFWAMQFFMEFNRNYKFEIKLVSETMALNIFHFVQERIEESREKLITDKKKIPIWSKRMHLGLKAYKELMETLLVMYQSKDPVLNSSARSILTNLFYMVEYRDLLLGLLNLYDEVKFSRLYLKDLIETNHIFMKLLENLGKKQRNLIVQRKAKTKKKTSKKSSKAPAQSATEDNDTMWTNISPDLTNIVQMNELVVNAIEARPYDPISDVPMEEQKVDTICRIRMHMRNTRLEEAVKLLRASREVWPEDGVFGNPGLNTNGEIDILKQIFDADLGTPAGYDQHIVASNDQNENEDNDIDEEDEEEDEESSQIRMEEANFEFIDFVKKFAKPKILQSCCQLLKDFNTNSTYTNHAVVKLLHRITYDCKYSALMFQASVFRIFQKLFSSKNPSHKELKHFAIFIMRKFTEIANKNKKVFMELLFWKDLKVAFEIEEGYDANEKTKSTNWNEEQEDELHRLHEEYLQKMPEDDEVTWICMNLIRQDRSRISVLKKLKQLGIVPTRIQKKCDIEFSEAEIVQITQLVGEFRESAHPIRFIMDRLDVKRQKKHIINKILELGLVGDRKELQSKKSKSSKKSNVDNDNDNGSSDGSYESENDDELVDSIHHSLTSVYVFNAIKKVIDRDMKTALLWLVESLNEAADDLDVDESDIPLLPLTDDCMTAVNDNDFQEAMKILGIHKPSSIQETYWRIPGRWQANDIRQRSETITSVIEGKFIVEDNINSVSRLEDSSDEDVEATFDRIRKSLVQNNVNDDTGTHNVSLNGNSSNVPSESLKKESNKENISFNKKKSLSKRTFLLEDSDEEDITKKIPLDDSDKDTDIEENIVPPKKMKTLKSNENIEKINTVKGRLSLDDSDEEDSDVGQKTIHIKKKKTIFEDSDDENVDDVSTIQSLLNVSSAEKNYVDKRKPLLSDSDSDEEIGMFINKNKHLKNQTTFEEKSLSKNSDKEDDSLETNSISMKRKKTMFEVSDDENVSDINIMKAQLDASATDKHESDKRKLLLKDSDSEEEIGAFVKKTKYIINDDSD